MRAAVVVASHFLVKNPPPAAVKFCESGYMTANDPDALLALARAEVLAWVNVRRPGRYSANAELADAFCELLPPDTDLELRTVRNPSSFMFEARWYHARREVEDFPKPFCAEEAGDARVLACAELLRMP
jgi:hypothetical protein